MSSTRMMFFFSSRRRHTRCSRDWSSDVCSSDLAFRTRGSFERAGRKRSKTTGRVQNRRVDAQPCHQTRSEEHTSELQSRLHLVCRLLLEKKKTKHKLISTQYTIRTQTNTNTTCT